MSDKKNSIGLFYAFQGILEVIKQERNFKIHVFMTAVVIMVSIYLKLTMLEWVIITIVISQVLVLEMINSAIERIIDYFKPEIHPKAKIIKDIAAGAVLVAALCAVIVGFSIFLPKILPLLND